MGKRIKVLISNSHLNCYGFRVLTEGIDLTQYKRNPILLWMHRRAINGSKDDVLPLGRMEDLEVVDGALYGVPVIEPVDDFSQNILKQWENGTLKMVSPRLEDTEWSMDKKLLVPGQTGATVVKCKLFEISIVDVGANDDAIQLYKDGKSLRLTNNGDCDIPLIINNKDKKMNEIQTIALALGLDVDATPADCIKQIAVLLSLKATNETLTSDLGALKLAAINGVIDVAVSEKRIKTEQKEHFISLGQAMGLEKLKVTLSAIPIAQEVKPLDLLRNSKGVQLGTTTYKKLSEVPAADMATLKKDDPQTYKTLYKAEYGFECTL